MKTSQTLILAGLLAFALTGVAQADRDHEHDDRAPVLHHDGYHQHGAQHDGDRRQVSWSRHHRHDRYGNGWHHRHQRHRVIWQRHYQRPRLYIRLPWLIYID
jgi:hypothetical protein